MTKADGADDKKRRDDRQVSLERYLLMNEKEKDVEIQKAIVRLQKRIQEILYLLEAEKDRVVESNRDKKETRQSQP